jgi:adenine-specific DNA-methyltransferase
MPRQPRTQPAARRRRIVQYQHRDKKRKNNPPVGLVTPATDRDAGRATYAYDPHLDPQLVWAGKAEHTSFDVPTVSLHVHERIDPRTIMEAVRKGSAAPAQPSLFEAADENLPLRKALEFYGHQHNWTNRLIAGDSLLVMNSLLEKEGLGGQVQMVYIDPPYGIEYGSNFQPFVGQRHVTDGKDEDLSQEPEMIRAFRDTWELKIHSYLTYLRDRLLLARDLLHESGSCFVQISAENVHLVRNLMDEVFEAKNHVSLINVKKSGMMMGSLLKDATYYLVWYARDKLRLKYRQLLLTKEAGIGVGAHYSMIESPSGKESREMTDRERADPSLLPEGWRPYALVALKTGGYRPNTTVPFTYKGQTFHPGRSSCWRTTVEGLNRLARLNRLQISGNTLRYKQYLEDFPAVDLSNLWTDTGTSGSQEKIYVVQTVPKLIQRCILMTTDPGDLVLDPTCGSGTTAFVAEQWGRRWITCDTSRVAVTLAKQRLITALYEFWQLAHPEEGVSSGLVYGRIPHITLGALANEEPTEQKEVYDDPVPDRSRARVTGPFTVEAVPAPAAKSLLHISDAITADESVARSGETLRQAEWRDELLKTGVRGKKGQMILFSRVEPLGGTRWLHADAETLPNARGADRVSEGAAAAAQRVVVSFGPEHAPLEQRQVETAWEEARSLVPRPAILLFAAFQFDAEAAKDIDELSPEKTGMTFLKVQMNADLLTEDLKKKRASNQSFWLIGQPDVEVRRVAEGRHRGKLQVEVNGFDYYNTRTGAIESGDTRQIAVWMLDTDYDGRSLFPRQVFFPMAGEGGGWSRIAKNLRAEIDDDLIEAYRGTVSLPFEAGDHRRIAVKIVDDRGIESLRVLEVA